MQPGTGRGTRSVEPNTVEPNTVLLVEDDAMLRRALARLVVLHGSFVVVGQAADGHQAIKACVELEPDLVLMDVRMPRMTGIEATRQIVRLDPAPKVIALTAYPTAEYLIPMLRAGASGYLLKDFCREDLHQAMLTVLTDPNGLRSRRS